MRKPKRRLGPTAGELPETEAPWRSGNVGRLMFNGARRFEERIHAPVREAGFTDIRFVHLTLVRNMNAGGTRLTTLAARAGMTKQAMSQLVDDGERLGIVERRPDPSDRRARLILFTPRGRALLQVVHRGIAAAEAEMESAVGHRLLAATRDALRAYLAEDGQGRGDEAA
jgi:DNA-binding MarR family transcriptional regulator